jgi:hypothetical protein
MPVNAKHIISRCMQVKLLMFLLLCFCSHANGQGYTQEASLKAAFIYNFTKYIEWEADETDQGSFTIGIIGSSAIDEPLGEIAKKNTVRNRRIIVHHFNSPEEIDYCNILFIPKKNPFSLPSILNKVSKGTLTISEEAGFARQGTAFNFVLVNDKLKFEANLKALYSANLKASSQLLKLAIIIDEVK